MGWFPLIIAFILGGFFFSPAWSWIKGVAHKA